MTRKVWKAAIELAKNYDSESITIGGGEPTLHPYFKEMLFDAIANFEYVWMATNGSQTEISITLSRLAKKGVLGVALSQDEYHDRIDPEVIQAFTKDKMNSGYGMKDNDLREIRNVTGNEIKAGRCKEGTEGCICSDIFIQPDGKIRGCGCHNAPTFGTVFSPKIPDYWQNGECSLKTS